MTEDDVRSYAREYLARYKVPKQVVLRPDPLPRNAAGKVVKADL